MHAPLRAGIAVALAIAPLRLASAADFKGSPAKMVRQHGIAVEESYAFLRTPADVGRLVSSGGLLPVVGNGDFTLSGVSFPVARAEVLSFVEHFAAEFHDSTGERLVVTSLTRPEATQPRNAHVLSVHPAGMAVDLRVPAASGPRAWFERELERLQRAGAIDVTREHSPPHYHIAVFAERWLPIASHADSLSALTAARAAAVAPSRTVAAAIPTSPDSRSLAGFGVSMLALAGLAIAALRVRHPSRHPAL